MRLFPGLFWMLAGQALIATAVPGALLMWKLDSGFQQHLRATDVARRADGSAMALPRATRPEGLTVQERAFLRDEFVGIGAVLAGTLVLLLVSAFIVARRWVRPQIELYRMSRDVAEGDASGTFEEAGPLETVATMRNLSRVASRFDRLENARRTWLVTTSEELRAPVEELGTRLDQLQRNHPSVDLELMDALGESRRRLTQAADDLQTVALADLGRLPVHFQAVDPRALVHNAMWVNTKRAQAKGVKIDTAKMPEYTILVKWDGPRIEQLFDALIDSSLRYTPFAGRIVLGLESQRDAWRLIIDDSAPGVDVMLAQQLFEPFYRSAADIERSGPGTTGSGLGLATARAIVEAHHGRIEASRSPIGGLRVTVVLPANPPTA